MTATSTTALNLLEDLVRIDSVNPGLDPDGGGEAQIAAWIARWGRSAGLRVDVLEGTTGRPSVIVRGGRGHGGRRLLLCGHLDTVGVAGASDGLTPRVEGDRLYPKATEPTPTPNGSAAPAPPPPPPYSPSSPRTSAPESSRTGIVRSDGYPEGGLSAHHG